MEEKITIIEGPPPVFEPIEDGWALGLNEGRSQYDMMLTRLRTFNGPALVERCHRAWSKQEGIQLHYRNDMGLEEKAPILAARSIETSDGHVLMLWCRLEAEEIEEEFDFGDSGDYDDDDDFV